MTPRTAPALLALLAGIMLEGCATHPLIENPPAAYRGDVTVLVRYIAPDQVFPACLHAGGSVVRRGDVILGCSYITLALATGAKPLCVEIMPNPAALGSTPYFQGLAVHENGHCAGWSPDHPSTQP
jgi:hypothetical protein